MLTSVQFSSSMHTHLLIPTHHLILPILLLTISLIFTLALFLLALSISILLTITISSNNSSSSLLNLLFHVKFLELLEDLERPLHLGLRFRCHLSSGLLRLRLRLRLRGVVGLLWGATLAGLAERTLKPEAFDLTVENVEALDLVYLLGGRE